MKLVLGGEEYTIKYGFQATIRSGILRRLAQLMETDGDELTRFNYVMEFMPDLIVVGLQTHHSDKFGYDYRTNDGWDKQVDKVYDLLDGYFENDDADPMQLFNSLQEEVTSNGFLAKALKSEREKVVEEKKKTTATTGRETIES